MKIQIPINLAYEDVLSEAILIKIFEYLSNTIDKSYLIANRFSKNGNGYLKRNIKAFNNAAKAIPFLILTDLDNCECPFSLISEWLNNNTKHPNLIFRVAVHEVEAWLLADAMNLSKYFSINDSWASIDPDSIHDPKMFLINLARSSPSRIIRESIVPSANSTAKVGKNYNNAMCEFVFKHWDIVEACQNSKSLCKLVNALSKFNPTWTS